MSSKGTMQRTARKRSGLLVIAAATTGWSSTRQRWRVSSNTSVPRPDEPICGSQEIIKRHLPIALPGSIVPASAEFRTSPDIGKREQTAAFHQECDQHTERGVIGTP